MLTIHFQLVLSVQLLTTYISVVIQVIGELSLHVVTETRKSVVQYAKLLIHVFDDQLTFLKVYFKRYI